MIVREEFALSAAEETLKKLVTTVIIGTATRDERCEKIKTVFENTNARVVSVDYDHDLSKFHIAVLNDPVQQKYHPSKDQFAGFFLRAIEGHAKNVLIDLTSLQHVVIMVLLNVLCKQVRPAHLFATYVKPQRYITRDSLGKYSFSTQIFEAEGIPGLIRQRKDNEIVVPFLGFEGDRLQNIIETMTYERIIPVIGFPSEDPAWKFDALRNCMPVLDNACPDAEIRKCKANSIFDAIQILNEINDLYPEKNFVLLPLGIRTHTAACGLWAASRRNVRIIYDYATESDMRSEGIGDTIVYHLSRFL